MQIEAGKRYVRRDGSVSGVIAKIDSEDYPFHDKALIATYTPNGIRGLGPDHWSDLVAEYVEPVSPSEVSGKEDAVTNEYDLSGIPAGYEFVGVRVPVEGEYILVPHTKAPLVKLVDRQTCSYGIVHTVLKPITPVQRTVVLHRWLVWDEAGKERMFMATETCVRSLTFKKVVDLGLYGEVKVNV